MRMQLAMRVALAALAVAVASCGPPYATPPGGGATAAESALASAVFQQVESYRRSHGGGVLLRHHGLDGLARRHSEFLRANQGKLSVNGPNLCHYGIEQRTLAAQCLYQINSIGENLARLNASSPAAAPAILKLWVNSPAHERNLRNDWTISGIGVAITDNGTALVTQIFGTRPSSSHTDMRARLRQH
ncbi:MAG: hypothetical protein RLZZ522_1100 [Verrucomicrobiota bacterium]